MAARPLEGYTVAVTADRRWRDQADWLTAEGATVVHGPTVADGRLPDDTSAADRLVEMILADEIDAATFTSTPAVEGLFALAGPAAAGVAAALSRAVVVCLGQPCRAAAVGHGVAGAQAPVRNRVSSVLEALAAALAARTLVLQLDTGVLTLRGSCAVIGEEAVRLTGRERAVLDALARRSGAVATRDALLREVWGRSAVGAHALEVTMGRLRRKLGPAGSALQTATRRGYRLATSIETAGG